MVRVVRCVIFFFLFFQAEDGIRDYKVTGVQTCALPISPWSGGCDWPRGGSAYGGEAGPCRERHREQHRANLPGRGTSDVDRKSTRLNSSHLVISYAVFCLKKENTSEIQSRFRLACITLI